MRRCHPPLFSIPLPPSLARIRNFSWKCSCEESFGWLRPAGGDPGIDLPQKIFFWRFVFLWVTLALLNPIESFLWRGCVVQATKNKEEVAPFLTPLGAARAARSADWLKIDMWENPSFDSSRSRQLVGTLQCTLSLSCSTRAKCAENTRVFRTFCPGRAGKPQRTTLKLSGVAKNTAVESSKCFFGW